ncbi:MAG: DUF4251 domain-containing protein [Bacteroidota bacterium]|nr:DUF4251 domain-containing protein [Bacteroidota bacterium]
MKNKISLLVSTFLVFSFLFEPINAQITKTRAQIQKAAVSKLTSDLNSESPHFLFSAQESISSDGEVAYLTDQNLLSFKLNNITSSLPYYGRSYYVVNLSTDKSPLEFCSKKFEFSITKKKKDGWDIIVDTKDQSEVRQLRISVFNNGKASIMVLFNNKTPMIFRGSIIPDQITGKETVLK